MSHDPMNDPASPEFMSVPTLKRVFSDTKEGIKKKKKTGQGKAGYTGNIISVFQ